MDPGIAHAGAPTSDQATLPIFRALLAIQVLAAAVFGLGPFVAPEAFASLGGLRGTEPFIYRLAGAATLGYGVAALIALGRPSWERVRIPIAATTSFNAAAVLAMAFSIADGESPWIVWFILVAASVFTLIGGYWLVRNQGPAEDRPRPVGGTFRLVLGVATLAATIFGVVPLLTAEVAANLAGFDTAELFPYRMAGAATLGYAAAGVLQLWAHADAMRPQVIAALVFNALSAVAVAFYLLGGGSAPIAILIGAAATAFSVAFAAWLLQDRSHSTTEVAAS